MKTFLLHINWNTLRLGMVFTQVDDGSQKFVMAYTN
jgi:hypothetical protein